MLPMKCSLNIPKKGMLPAMGRIVAPMNTRLIVFAFVLSTLISVLYPDRNIRKMRPN